jgi:hypothetical protein
MRQKVVYFLKNRTTMLLPGDPDLERYKHGEVLPALLADGWKLASVHMTASAAVNDDQVLGIGILEAL